MGNKRKIIGRAEHADGKPWANAFVSFQLHSFSYTAHEIYPRDRVSVSVDPSGDFEVELWTNEDGLRPCEYVCRLPSNEEFKFILPPGNTPIDLPTLISMGVPAQASQSLLSLIDDRIAQVRAKANRLPFVAAIDLAGHRVVQINPDGKAIYADNIDFASSNAIGITTHAAAAEEIIEIATFREFSEPSWDWIPGKPLFLGESGHLTQTPPLSGVLLPIAKALSPIKIFISIQSPTIRS